MTEQLFLRLIEAGNAYQAQWCLYSDGHQISASEVPVELTELSIPEAGTERRITVLVPGQNVLITRANVSQPQRRYIKKIVPFLLEEQLADPLSELHIVTHGSVSDSGDILVAVVKNTKMEQWQQILNAARITADRMIPETALLDTGQLIYSANMIWFCRNTFTYLCIEPSMLQTILEKMGHDGSKESLTIDCIECGTEDSPEVARIVQSYPHISVKRNSAGDVFEVFCEQLIKKEDFLFPNLLQGGFKGKGYSGRLGGTKYFILAMIFWFFGLVLLNALEGGYAHYKASELRTKSVALYRQHYPQDSKIIDPRKQMEAHLVQNQQSGTGFITVLQKLASVWKVNTSESLQMEQLNYEDTEGTLKITVSSTSMDAINQLLERMKHENLEAKTQSIENTNKKFIGNIIVKEGVQ